MIVVAKKSVSPRGLGLLLNAAVTCSSYLTEGTTDVIAGLSNVIIGLAVVDSVVLLLGLGLRSKGDPDTRTPIIRDGDPASDYRQWV